VLTPTLLSQWRERLILHYLPPGKYQPRYHIFKLDTVYMQRINVIQYTTMEKCRLKYLVLTKNRLQLEDKEITI